MKPAPVLLLLALVWGCGGGGVAVDPPVGTIGYTVLNSTYLGAATSNRTGPGAASVIRIVPTFSTARYLTLRIPRNTTAGSHLTSNVDNGTYFIRLDDSDGIDPFNSPFESTAGGGTIVVASITQPTDMIRGHIEGAFSGVLRDQDGLDTVVTQGTFSCDFDGP